MNVSNQRFAILGGRRTPFVKAFGPLSAATAVDLGVAAVSAAIRSQDLSPSDVDEVIIGNVAGPADAANIARVISLQAEVPPSRIAHTVNRNCGSGMEAIVAATQALRDGRAQVVVAGGTESMSNIPFLFHPEYKSILQSANRAATILEKIKCFSKLRPKHFKPLIGIQLGLTDPTCRLNMGQTAELLGREFGISRADQDRFAVESHNRALAAVDSNFLSGEIVPWRDAIAMDLGPRKGQSLEQLAKLRPIFEKDGTVTAGNSCPLTDGAAALVLASDAFVSRRGVSPLGYVSAIAIHGCDPRRMGLGPVYAIAKLLKQTGLSLKQIDLIEINEAFAAQVLACLAALESKTFAERELGNGESLGGIDRERLNVHGGAIALGHPVGTTGTRLVLTLIRALRERKLKRGISSLCIGGGQGMAMLLEVD